jgi:hypothetical protein
MKIWKRPRGGSVTTGYQYDWADLDSKRRVRQFISDDEILVRVSSFTFRFVTLGQLRDCLAFFEQKVRPSGRIPAKRLASELGEDWRMLRGWDIERWDERLPMYLLEEPKRQKIVVALRKAIQFAETGKRPKAKGTLRAKKVKREKH